MNQLDEEEDDDEEDAMKELQRLLKMQSSADWQQVTVNLFFSNSLDGAKPKKI